MFNRKTKRNKLENGKVPERTCITTGTIHTANLPNSVFGGLEVACWPLVPKFAGSNPIFKGK